MQHKLRSALSVLGIVCGVTAVLTMLSLGEGARQTVIRQIEQLGITNIYLKAAAMTEEQKIKAGEKLSEGLNLKDRDRIRAGCLYIKDIACLKEVTASVFGMPKDISPQMAAVSSNYLSLLNLFASQGRFIADQDIAEKNLICVLGSSIAGNSGTGIGDDIRIENHLFKVVGMLDKFDRKTGQSSVISVRNYNEMIFIPLGTDPALQQFGEKAMSQKTSELSEIVVQMSKAGEVLAAGEIIKRIVSVSHHQTEDYQMIIPRELLRQTQKTQRTFNIFLGSVACISLLIGGIGIMNIMLATVSERRKEIGIRRAVGARRKDIVIQFLAEAVMLTFTGGIFGIWTGLAAVRLISAFAGWNMAITFSALILPLIMSVCVGIFFGLYPACQAANTDPIRALRYE